MPDMDFVLGPDDFIEYVLEDQRDREDPPVMLIRNLTQAEHREYMRALRGRKDTTDLDSAIELQSDVLKIGWAGWRNVKDGDGKSVPFDADANGRPTDRQIDRLKLRHRAELFTAIGNQSSELSEDQRKNLGLPSRSTPGASSETANDADTSQN